MDEGVGKLESIEEWIEELFSNVAADDGMGRGALTMPPSNANNFNKQTRAMSLEEKHQVLAIAPNNSPGTTQYSHHPLDCSNILVRQSMASSSPKKFSQSQASPTMISKLHQQQQQELQNQVMGQVIERPNMCQLQNQLMWQVTERPNMYYANNLREHPQQQPSLRTYATSHMVQRTDQAIVQKALVAQGSFQLPRTGFPMAAFHQSQNLPFVNQLKAGNRTQPMHLRQSQALSASSSQVELTNSIDWIDQAFQKLLQIKNAYLSNVVIFFKKERAQIPWVQSAELGQDQRLLTLARLFKFLKLSKSDMLNFSKEKMFLALDNTLKQCIQIRAMLSHGKQRQQAEASKNWLEAPQMQQRENCYQFNCSPENLQQQHRLAEALSSPEMSLNSSKVNASLIMNSNPYGNQIIAAPQKWASHGSMVPLSPHEGFNQRSQMLLHRPHGVAQHINMGTPQQQKVVPPRSIFNSLDSSVNLKVKPPVAPMWPDKNKKQEMLHHLRQFAEFNLKKPPIEPSCSSQYVGAPQILLQSSSQHVQELSSKLLKSGTPPPSTYPHASQPLLTPSLVLANHAQNPLSRRECTVLPKTSYDASSQLRSQDGNQNQLPANAAKPVKTVSSSTINTSLQDLEAAYNLTYRINQHPNCLMLGHEIPNFENQDSILENEIGMNSDGKWQLKTKTRIFDNSTTRVECANQPTKRLKKTHGGAT